MTTNKIKIQIIDKGEIYYYEIIEPAETERFDEILQKKKVIKYDKKFRIDPTQLSIFPEATIASLNTNLNTSYTLEQITEMIQHAEAIKDEKEFGPQKADINPVKKIEGKKPAKVSKGQNLKRSTPVKAG